METDKQLYKLFTAAPGQLYLLLGLPAPKDRLQHPGRPMSSHICL